MTGFFAFKNELAQIKAPSSITLIESGLSWNGDSLPHYPNSKPKISILKITIPPQSELPLHFHPVINAGILLQGELLVQDEDGNSLEMKAGDPIIEVVNKMHWGVNQGNEPVEIVVFYAGSEGMKITEIVGD
ncbi:cupin domain-containing protein [Algoriphagus halophytocola]|uniref:Cupin domain-containing protein n=1 Tax=Algoriphagus halophytocola TaxID=2991499 RepID=A0ABY6MG73_9BACT|nr:cupin domain-containing protein [Algoriphagus sp. TR-M5]UZD22638.1 cupin domain-containing protein [Algoriphagus sp. TR-M5]